MKRFILGLIVGAVLCAGAIAQEYQLRVGDVIAVEVIEDSSLNRQVLIQPDGRISFPFAGSIPAANRSLSQVEANLRTALAPNFATPPTIFVGLASLSPEEEERSDTISIYVIGEVDAPGRKEVERGTTFLQALAETGGFTPFAAQRRIQLRRADPASGQEFIYRFDLRAVSDGARISGNSNLRDGDVILVPERRLFE